MEQAIQDVLAELGLPQFEMGSDGYPIPGRVVKHYREMMKYTDRHGRERHWTQKDLAEKLGISEIMVNLMEKHNQGLDSIERRRVLTTILKIPPVLLGLGSLDRIVELVTRQHAPTQAASTSHPDYQNTYNVYKKMYRDGLSYMILRDIERQTKQLEDDLKNSHLDDKELLLHLLWQHEVLCAKIFSADVSDWAKTFEHIDNAKDIATYLDDRDLQAASLCYSAIFHFRQGRIGAAKMDIDGAATYAKGSLSQTRGIICSKSACIYAESDTSTSGIVLVQSMLDKAEKSTESREDRATISFGKDDFYLDKAYVLNRLNRHAKALEMLEDAERYVQAAGKRHSVFLEIKKAQCYIEQKKPEYEQAIWMLLNAVETSKEIKVARNMEQVNKLYEKLAASSHAKSPDVVDLGMQIQKLKRSAF